MNIRKFICAASAIFHPSFAPGLDIAEVPEKHGDVLAEYCFECHDSLTEKGGIDLEDLSFRIDAVGTAETWQKVLNAMNSGEMPPEDEPQLSDEEKIALLQDLSGQLVVAREQLSDTGGTSTMRRLNRREYENTIEALLGVRIEAENLPDDANSGGFDTTGSALFFSADQFEQYLAIARDALDEAFLFGKKKPKPVRVEFEPETSKNAFFTKTSGTIKANYDKAQNWRNSDGSKPPSHFGLLDEFDVKFRERLYNQQYEGYRKYLDDPRTKDAVLLQPFFNGTNTVTVKIPNNAPRGEFRLQVFAKTLKGAERSETYIEYGFPGARSGEIERLGCVQVPSPKDKAEPLTLPVTVSSDGPRDIILRHRQHNNRDAARGTFLQSQQKTGTGPPAKLAIDKVILTGPHYETWPPRAVSEVFFKGMWWTQADQDAYAREIIARFARRAFRVRQPSPAFIDRLHKLYLEETIAGKKFYEAIREPLAIVLASPGFLYLAEPVGEASGKRDKKTNLSDAELAVRLSYLLWSAPPDQKLMADAKSGKLAEKGVLRAHAGRLLDDRRSDEFISSLAHQWLHMERLDFFQFDFRSFPEFDDSMKESARSEVFETIRHILKNRLPASDLLDADYVVVNNLLAGYYGLGPVEGNHFRRIPVPEDTPRGGFLGMAAVHAMGSDGNHSSPVERGVWVMRYLLNDPPPPAPPNVPQLSRVRGKLLSPREELDAHMEEAQCAQCHRRIDPIGFGLQNFDPVGQWREVLHLKKTKGRRVVAKKEVTIDPAGQLPDGSTFEDFYGLRREIAKHGEAFTRGFAEALIEYGLGRPYGFSDENLRERMLKRANAADGSMRELVLAFIESESFRRKK